MTRRSSRRSVWLAATVAAVMLGLPALAVAHLERPSYWPDPAPDTTVTPRGRRRGAAGALAGLGAERRRPGRRAGRLQGQPAGRSRWPTCARRCARPSAKGYRLRPSQPKIKLSKKREADRLLTHQRRAGQAVRVRLGPGGGLRRGQQRPSPDHARPLHRAGLAQRPGERPDLQPQPAPGGRQRRPDPELRVPGDLSQRPEPDLRAGARGGGRPAGAAALTTARGSRLRSSARACAATCRSRAPARSPRT